MNSENIGTVEAILPCNHSQMAEQAKYTYSRLGKAFEKQTKTIKGQGFKIQSFKSFKSYRITKAKIDWRRIFEKARK